MKIALVQKSFPAGQPQANYLSIRSEIKKLEKEEVDLMILPACALDGFQASDLLKKSKYLHLCRSYFEKLARLTERTALIMDLPSDGGNRLLVLAQHGKILCEINSSIPVRERDMMFNGVKIQIGYREESPDFGVYGGDISVVLDAYPFAYDQETAWRNEIHELGERLYNLIYVNQSGGQNAFILRGGSAVRFRQWIDRKDFEEDIFIFSWTGRDLELSPKNKKVEKLEGIALVYHALVAGIKDYFARLGINKAVLGLSGGIDSAVVLPLAVAALGRQNVLGIMMPSRFSTEHSVKDAVQSAENLKIHYHIIPIEPIFKAQLQQLQPLFAGTEFGLAEENIQARIRGNILMAISNKFGYLLLNTSNKSEAICGYGTLYGDLCGGMSVIGDLYKSEVYELADYINRKKEIIPRNSIEKAPSAELRPNQKDSDSLPDYDLIEKIARLHLEKDFSSAQMEKEGIDKTTANRIVGMIYRNEYKRRQMPFSLRVSSTNLAADRKFPLMVDNLW